MTHSVRFLSVYNKLSETCCVISQQANSVTQYASVDDKMHPDQGTPDDGGPHAVAQLALWLIRLWV